MSSPVAVIGAEGFPAGWLSALLSSEATPRAGPFEAFAALVAEQSVEELVFLARDVLGPGKRRGIVPA